MNGVRRFGWMVAAGGVGVALVAASLPSAMMGPGLWEVAKSAHGHGAQRVCLADPALLTQWEHRRGQCTRSVIKSAGEHAEISYKCAGGDFGTSKVRVLTPRTLRIDTQGISRGLPFAYVLHARKIGSCPAR